LLLPANVKLIPAESVVAPLELIDPNITLDELMNTALANRPDLAANREAIAAAWSRLKRQERGPLFPKMVVANQVGSFGGGFNDVLGKFDARNALGAQIFWEIKNLGFGNRADAAERRAILDQAQSQLLESQARATAEIVETAQIAGVKFESVELAQQGIKAASELYRLSTENTSASGENKNLFDALRPLQSIQLLNQARLNYLSAVIEFNRSQYRLLTLIGTPASTKSPASQIR
jgi:outer membrane protein TolC